MEGSFASPLLGRETISSFKENIPTLNSGASSLVAWRGIDYRLVDGFQAPVIVGFCLKYRFDELGTVACL